jgi:predicted HAD superfamily Cof-like phosphohydrolase
MRGYLTPYSEGNMLLQNMIDNVSHFHSAIGASISAKPRLLAHEKSHCTSVAKALRGVCDLCEPNISEGNDLLARVAMAAEELAEWVESHERGDLVAAADAWGDRLYVLLGDAVVTGLPADAIFAEVHRSNMTKATVDSRGKARKTDAFDRPLLAAVFEPPEDEQG